MKRLLSLTATAAVAAGAVSTVAFGASAAAAAPAAAFASPGAYVGITPSRALDTRTNGGALGQGATRQVGLAGLVPSTTATAVVLNLTVTDPTAPGYLTVFPDGVTRPTASSINKRAGETRSNSVTVALPTSGTRVLDVYNQAGSSQVVVDVLGYYDPARNATGAQYFSNENPGRPVDTRPDPLSAGAGVDGLEENSFLSSHQVSAVAVNITAVDVDGPGYLTAWNGVGAQPPVSTVNYGLDAATPNFAIVPVVQHEDRSISFRVQNNVSDASVVVDVLGYYTAPATGGALYVPVTPRRVTDTRVSGGPLAQNEARLEAVTEFPPLTTAVNLNATVVDATRPTFLTVYYPDTSKPFTSNLNPTDATARANAVQTSVSGTTQEEVYSVYNQQGSVDFVADVQGWFVFPQA